MCFNVSLYEIRSNLETRFNAKFLDPDFYIPIYHVSAFSTPLYPIIANDDREHIQFFQWGLIPFWVKDEQSAKKIRFQTFNARAETIHEKASFRSAVKDKRCLVLVNGFYDWREVGGKNFPYYIKLPEEKVFTLAGIWDSWKNKQTGETKRTFSIITTKANPLMERIHNKKKRMPVILDKDLENRWLEKDLDVTEINSFLKPFDENKMEAYPVSKIISKRGANTNIPEVIDKVEYEELKFEQKNLF